MITAKGQVDDRITGLDAGADDYLVKPFSSRELLARVHALLRRFESAKAPVDRIRLGEVEIDFSTQVCARKGDRVPLTAKEFSVLKLLAERRGAPVIRISVGIRPPVESPNSVFRNLSKRLPEQNRGPIWKRSRFNETSTASQRNGPSTFGRIGPGW
jgi:hypothetical protein